MGIRIRNIKTETRTINGVKTVVPVLDANGNDIELWSVDVPPEIEADGGIPKHVDCTDVDALGQYIVGRKQAIVDAKAAVIRERTLAAERQAVADAAADAKAETPPAEPEE